jgi:hypothetical protein
MSHRQKALPLMQVSECGTSFDDFIIITHRWPENSVFRRPIIPSTTVYLKPNGVAHHSSLWAIELCNFLR